MFGHMCCLALGTNAIGVSMLFVTAWYGTGLGLDIFDLVGYICWPEGPAKHLGFISIMIEMLIRMPQSLQCCQQVVRLPQKNVAESIRIWLLNGYSGVTFLLDSCCWSFFCHFRGVNRLCLKIVLTMENFWKFFHLCSSMPIILVVLVRINLLVIKLLCYNHLPLAGICWLWKLRSRAQIWLCSRYYSEGRAWFGYVNRV